MAVTWNPLDKGSAVVLSNGNLTANLSTGFKNGNVRATKGVSSGKWYWETHWDNGQNIMIAVSNINASLTTIDSANFRAYYYDGRFYPGGATVASYAVGDTIGIALDMDAGTVGFYKNGVYQGIAFSDVKSALGSPIYPYQTSGSNTSHTATTNFGATPFAYSIPDGYTALDSGTPIAIDIAITATKATTTSQAHIPIISISKNIFITAPKAIATNQAIIPLVSATSNFDVNINGVLATSSNQAIAPTITTEIVSNASIIVSRANCTSQSKVPFITAIINEIAEINISESTRKPIIQANTRNHMINQLTRRIRTEVI